MGGASGMAGGLAGALEAAGPALGQGLQMSTAPAMAGMGGGQGLLPAAAPNLATMGGGQGLVPPGGLPITDQILNKLAMSPLDPKMLMEMSKGLQQKPQQAPSSTPASGRPLERGQMATPQNKEMMKRMSLAALLGE
jgi:hypothetical protein